MQCEVHLPVPGGRKEGETQKEKAQGISESVDIFMHCSVH
jgi:hypothetical protein